MATHRTIDRPAFAAALLQVLESHLGQVATAFPELIAETARRSVLLRRWVQLRSGQTILEGRAEGLDEDGHLLLRHADGTLTRVTAGEVTVVTD